MRKRKEKQQQQQQQHYSHDSGSTFLKHYLFHYHFFLYLGFLAFDDINM